MIKISGPPSLSPCLSTNCSLPLFVIPRSRDHDGSAKFRERRQERKFGRLDATSFDDYSSGKMYFRDENGI